MAYSDNGTSFTEWGKILSVGAAGTWDDYQVKQFCLYWNQGVWYVLYTGYDNGPGMLRIGLAYSYNGFREFDKYPYNPILDKGAGGEWDDNRVTFPNILQVEDEFWIYFAGYDGSTVRDLGIAYIP